MVFIRPSVCLCGTCVHCDHTVHFKVGFYNVLGPLTPKHVHLFTTVFFQLHVEQRWGMDAQAIGEAVVYTNSDK